MARPERPSFDDVTPAPVTGPAARTKIADRTMLTLWWSVSLLAFAAITLFLTRKTAQDNLAALLMQSNTSLDSASLETPIARLVDVVMATLLVLSLIQAWCITSLGRGRRWPRLTLIPVALLQVAVAIPTSLLAPHGSWQGWLVTIALLLGVVAVLGGLVLVWTPAMSRWLSGRRAAMVAAGKPR